jgi:hypothetical protein
MARHGEHARARSALIQATPPHRFGSANARRGLLRTCRPLDGVRAGLWHLYLPHLQPNGGPSAEATRNMFRANSIENLLSTRSACRTHQPAGGDRVLPGLRQCQLNDLIVLLGCTYFRSPFLSDTWRETWLCPTRRWNSSAALRRGRGMTRTTCWARRQPALDRPDCDLRPRVHCQLLADVLEVAFDRPLGDEEAPCGRPAPRKARRRRIASRTTT